MMEGGMEGGREGGRERVREVGAQPAVISLSHLPYIGN